MSWRRGKDKKELAAADANWRDKAVRHIKNTDPATQDQTLHEVEQAKARLRDAQAKMRKRRRG
jgi:hypothetical protein